MNILFHRKTQLGVTVLSFAAAVVVCMFCPMQIPIHFVLGQGPDLLVNKFLGLFILPVVMTVCLLSRAFYYRVGWAVYLFAALQIFVLYQAAVL
ncbi:DUF1648 domain-containing protein [Paenibacillus sp. GbtcB18]|uniref:DUF1648 domain-containing protein n=1 Tax=Paenibacillus sp. GbtcB18 TaxID=2824763 RepID=UPI001C2F92A4|nr:DUF1648 domain-containing protein [Paenibacillus sp. GbtcB18]